jgi:hypothetical protein
MARPRHEQPTPAELEILKILWQHGDPASVRAFLRSSIKIHIPNGLIRPS